MDELAKHRFDITGTREDNTRRLMEIPGLAETICLTVGNAFFIPAGEEDKDKPWKNFKLDIDGRDHLFFCKHAEVPRHVHPYPAEAFTGEGIKLIFKHAPPPVELLQCLAASARYRAELEGKPCSALLQHS